MFVHLFVSLYYRYSQWKLWKSYPFFMEQPPNIRKTMSEYKIHSHFAVRCGGIADWLLCHCYTFDIISFLWIEFELMFITNCAITANRKELTGFSKSVSGNKFHVMFCSKFHRTHITFVLLWERDCFHIHLFRFRWLYVVPIWNQVDSCLRGRIWF